jgi:hypothetical protein
MTSRLALDGRHRTRVALQELGLGGGLPLSYQEFEPPCLMNGLS